MLNILKIILIVANVHNIILMLKINLFENNISDNLCASKDCNQLYISMDRKAQIAPKS